MNVSRETDRWRTTWDMVSNNVLNNVSSNVLNNVSSNVRINVRNNVWNKSVTNKELEQAYDKVTL